MIPIEPAAAVIAAGSAFAAVLAVMGLASLVHAPHERVLDRVNALEHRTPYARDGVDIMRDRSTSDIGFLDRLLRDRPWAVKAAHTLERAGLELRVGEYLSLRALAVVVPLLVASIVARRFGFPMLPAMLVGGILGFFAPIVYVRRRIGKRRSAVEGQLIELCDLMGSMLRSGFGYMQAITTTADQIGAPLSLELRRVVDGVRVGVDVDEAFESMNTRLDSNDFSVLATAMNIQRRTGGNLAEILDGVAETIRDRQSLRQEIAALTAMEKTTCFFASGFPMVMACILMLLSPYPFRLLLTDPLGRTILLGAIVLDVVGFLVMRRVTRLEA